MLTSLAGAIFAKQIHRFNIRIFPWAYRHWWFGYSPIWDHWRIRFIGIALVILGFLAMLGKK